MITLRVAKESDLEAVHSIEERVYPKAWTLKFFRLMLGTVGDQFLVAEVEGKVVGYTVGEHSSLRSNGVTQSLGHIMNVAVKDEFQEKGVGTFLLDAIEDRLAAKGAEMLYLEVRESNKVAQTVYTKRGYQYVRTSKDYYEDEDAFIMMKSTMIS